MPGEVVGEMKGVYQTHNLTGLLNGQHIHVFFE